MQEVAVNRLVVRGDELGALFSSGLDRRKK